MNKKYYSTFTFFFLRSPFGPFPNDLLQKIPEISMSLPQDCWELIFNSIDHRLYFQSLSLVCTMFLSITNRLRHTFTVTDQTIPLLSRLLSRFPNLKRISIGVTVTRGNSIDFVLSQVSRSMLDLESLSLLNQRTVPVFGLRDLGLKMRNLREFDCSRVFSLQDTDLIVIASSFPFLEELDISYPEYGHGDLCSVGWFNCNLFPISDSGVMALSFKLKRLRKINLSGNQFITDKSLLSLSINCQLLTEIAILGCDFITQNGISFAMCNSQTLESVSMDRIGIPSMEYNFMESFRFVRGLTEIHISTSYISDKLLSVIAEANLPLKKLGFPHCYNFTLFGISILLSKYQSLEYLDLEGANFLKDESMIKFSTTLTRLTSVNLSLCSKLTSSTFFAIIKNCPLLTNIQMERTNLGLDNLDNLTSERARNSHVKSLSLGGNYSLSDEFLLKVSYACPCLEMLDVSYCSGITETSVLEILKHFSNLRKLKMNRYVGKLTNLITSSLDFEICNLEVLQVGDGAIDDEELGMISERCRGLLKLDIQGCLSVTDRGVKEVVEKCKMLKEINLKWCDNVSVDIVGWMVFTRRSLRKIIPPSGFVFNECQTKFFFRHGCLIREY